MQQTFSVFISSLYQHRWLIGILFLFGLIYGSIALVNHYNFRTYALDLGLFNHAFYSHAHLRTNEMTLIQQDRVITNFLADHFEVLMWLIAPLYWLLTPIFGTATLLVLQISAILFGGVGIFKCLRVLFADSSYTTALWGTFHFFSIWGIYGAVGFDYHNNVIGTMFVPWLFYYFYQNKWLPTAIFFALILSSKETMILWAVFISLGLAWLNYRNTIRLKTALIMFGLASLYFVLVVKLFRPAISSEAIANYYFQFDALGKNVGEALTNIISSPFNTFRLLLESHSTDPASFGIKPELHTIILFSGGLALFYRPQFLLMLLPIYAIKLFTNDFVRWGINLHYSIEYAPILVIAWHSWITKTKRLQVALAGLGAVLCLFVTIAKLDNRVSKWYAPDNVKFYDAKHYTRNFDVKALHTALATIPPDVPVSASHQLVPHLSFRPKIYHYPHIADAEYILVLDLPDESYPLKGTAFTQKFQETSAQYRLIQQTGCLYIFKK